MEDAVDDAMDGPISVEHCAPASDGMNIFHVTGAKCSCVVKKRGQSFFYHH